MEEISEAAAVSLPLMNSVRGNIRQQRHRNELPNPPNRAEIFVLPQLYQITSIGAQFPRYNSEIKDDGQILKFVSDQSLELLSDSEHWLCNGTSKVCPEIFYHVTLKLPTSQWTSSTLFIRNITKQKPTSVSNTFQGSLKSYNWHSTRYQL